MSFIIKTKSLQTIYKSLGLEDRGRIQQFMGKKVADNLKKYVSYNSGTQSDLTNPINGGNQVIINVPYARFQAGGKVMVGIYSHSPWAKRGERKVVTSKDLTYQGGGLRGSHPFERMKADKRDSILFQVAKEARRIADG